MAVQGEAEIISDPEKLPDVVRCSPVSWRCWYMNILQWFYLHSHSRHVFWWNWHEAARVTNGDPFVYMLLLILLEDTVTSQEPPVWMKIFLPLYLPASPPPPSLCSFVTFQWNSTRHLPTCFLPDAASYHFCFFSKCLLWSPASVLVPVPRESRLCGAGQGLIAGRLILDILSENHHCLPADGGCFCSVLFSSTWIQV